MPSGSSPCAVEDLVGRTFWSFKVLALIGDEQWSCECQCGNEVELSTFRLRSGVGRLCQCYDPPEPNGLSTSEEYNTFRLILRRTCDPHDSRYHDYAGRGIGIAACWLGAGGFERFLDSVGPRPTPDHQLDRIDNDRGYEPGNCRWATRAVQARNTRRTILMTLGDKTQCLTDWAAELGYTVSVLRTRLKNLPLDQALTRAPAAMASQVSNP